MTTIGIRAFCSTVCGRMGLNFGKVLTAARENPHTLSEVARVLIRKRQHPECAAYELLCPELDRAHLPARRAEDSSAKLFAERSGSVPAIYVEGASLVGKTLTKQVLARLHSLSPLKFVVRIKRSPRPSKTQGCAADTKVRARHQILVLGRTLLTRLRQPHQTHSINRRIRLARLHLVLGDFDALLIQLFGDRVDLAL